MEPLEVSLEQYHFDVLREIASNVGVETGNTRPRKAWLVEQLARVIPYRIKNQPVIESLGDAEQAILGLILDAGGEISVSELLFPLTISRLAVPNQSLKGHSGLPTMYETLDNLLRQALVVNLTLPPTSTRRNFTYVQTVAIPPEVQNLIPRSRLSTPKPQPIKALVSPPLQVVHHDAEQFLRQLFFIWAELRRKPAKQLKSGAIGKRDLRRIAGSIGLTMESEAEESWLRQICALLESIGLLTIRNRMIVTIEDEVALRFWNSNTADQLQKNLRAYMRSTPEEAVNLNPVTSQVYYYGYLYPREFSVLRQEIIDLLARFPSETWIPYSYFSIFLNQSLTGAFLFPVDTVMDLEQRFSRYRGERQRELQKALQKVENDVITKILSQLNDFGLIDLGYDIDTTIEGLRLTPLGQATLTNQPYIPSTPEGQVVLQPDFQLLVMGPIPLGQIAALERFLERESVTESVVTYRITRDSIYPALQSGDTIGAILAFLRQVTDQPVPQNVERTLEEWSALHERILVHRDVFILQTDAPEKLSNLLEDTRIGKYLHAIDERTAWLHPNHAKRIKQRLWALEYLPAVSKGAEADLPDSLEWENDKLRSRHILPSLYVESMLRRIAHPIDDAASPSATRRWHLTPESIKSGVMAGLTAPEIITVLEQMTGTEISSKWEKRIKAWASHYGEGQLAHVVLLRLESSKALRELRQNVPSLRRWLQPLPHTRDGVAVVDAAHLDEVKAALEEWGVEISAGRWW